MNVARRIPHSPADLIEVLGRRKWWILVTWSVVSVVAFVGVRRMPRMYASKTTIMVDPQKVPADFIRSTVSADLDSTLVSIEEKVLSRANLESIIHSTDLYADDRKHGMNDQQLVELMIKDIQVDTITDFAGAHLGGFSITYSNNNPQMAQQIDYQLGLLFIRQNTENRAAQATGTQSFLKDQTDQAQQRLQQAENNLRKMEAQFPGSLPDQQGQTLSLLNNIGTQLAENDRAESSAKMQKQYLTMQLEALKPGADAAPPPPPSALQVELDKDEADLAALQLTFKPDYPSVTIMKDKVDSLKVAVAKEDAAQKKRADAAEAALASKSLAADPTANLKAQIALYDSQIAAFEKTGNDLQSKEKVETEKLQAVPEVANKIAGVEAEYELAKNQYDLLQKDEIDANMSAAMESQAESEVFQTVDPANLPQIPSSPNVPLLLAGGVLGGLLFGLSLAAVAEFRDGRIFNERDILHYLGHSPIALVPELRDDSQPRGGWWRRRRKAA